MKAVVLAGGRGTRLNPLTLRLPKPLVPLLNKPVMEYSLQLLKAQGIQEIIVTLQYMGERIKNYFGDGSKWGVNITYLEEQTPLGTAGGVKNAEHLLKDPFIVISGDALTDFDLMAGVAFHRKKHSLFTIFMKEVRKTEKFGVMKTDYHGQVTKFIEKPKQHASFSKKVNTGIYIVDPSIFCLMKNDIEYDFSKDIFPKLIKNEMSLFGYKASGYWKDIGCHEDYWQAQYDLLANRVKLPMREDYKTHESVR
ncbi:D-glycero-alpha-D-manno-heptose 1-phosphate guanylyltransferase [Bacillus sp. THAF10]|uniref:nucleotidyltransferase family protein n=1 Tax=Bacillus sp. THAF10 TaxID=2587848 RepID=UPI001267B131|nr:NDP-sugar synthase [Bacillus sp. THAF10]QFT89841.1 D-glycero-alpha-D-manno-heptose 1-phosphate guanylyltransferase [Bacillus sp. THAF10]